MEENKKHGEDPSEIVQPTIYNPAAMIYAAKFNNESNIIMAAGAGDNQVRLFDIESGTIVCQISQLGKPIICMTKANKSNDFAFGSTDSKVRIISQRAATD